MRGGGLQPNHRIDCPFYVSMATRALFRTQQGLSPRGVILDRRRKARHNRRAFLETSPRTYMVNSRSPKRLVILRFSR